MGNVFGKVHTIQQPLMFQPQFDVIGHKTFVENIAYTQGIAACLVHISGAYAFEGAAYFVCAFGYFRSFVQCPVCRYYNVGSFADVKVFCRVYAKCGHLVTLVF